jgi:hypothetical protein
MCDCGGSYEFFRNPMGMLASSVPTLKCNACGRIGRTEQIGKSLFQVQKMPVRDLNYESARSKLVHDAAVAHEMFSQEDLEEYADAWRKKK